MHRKLGDAVHGAENRGNAPDLSAIVQDTLHRAGQGSACCDGSVKYQHIFAVDHGLDIIPEDHLAYAVVFRRGNINRLVGVHGENAGLGQFFRQIGAHYFQSVHTHNGINRNGSFIIGGQSLRDPPRFGASGFHCGNVQKMCDV